MRRTIESYLATTEGADTELFVVDNASTDDSRSYLASLQRQNPRIQVVLLEENVGGEAFNVVLPSTKGALTHLSENDQEFLPGWLEHVWQSFDSFDDLGQLSLHHDVPSDDEAWEQKPSHLRFKDGKILYEAHANVGTSSILRAEIFRDHGVRVKNYVEGSFKFPADGLLSDDVKRLGYWAAWSDRYYANNLGHFVEEFERSPDYYRKNYASKRLLGEEGWRARIALQQSIPRPKRSSVVFPEKHVVPEKTMQPVGKKPARIWSMFDGWTAEVETLDFIYALVRLVKPRAALETGTWLGWSACYVGKAMEANGFGHLVSLEVNPGAFAVAERNVTAAGVERFVELRLESSMHYVPTSKFEFAMFDSETALRESEFRRFSDWIEPGAVIVFHDTGPQHRVVGEAVRRLVSEQKLVGLEFATPRGLFVGRVPSHSEN